MYKSISDPYCYPDTDILINIPKITTQEKLDDFEVAITTQQESEGFPSGDFGVQHYKSIHHHLFQDAYNWAGKYRTVRISKGKNIFLLSRTYH